MAIALSQAEVTRPTIRPLARGDDLEALTVLIHAAYAPQAQRGLRYWGTHQTVEDTRKRFAAGIGLVALLGSRFVGTITAKPPQPESPVALYRDPHTWTLGQYAVHPDMKGRGLGRDLHDYAVAVALEHGARTVALDTAAPAEGLIAMYRRWGYEVAGEADWRPHTNYVSVVMRKALLDPMALLITLESPAQPDVIALIDALDAFQKPLYPAESHHGIDIAALSRDNVLFAVVRTAGGEAIACGAIVLEPGYGELKRMYTRPAFRGRGIARRLLALLEEAAGARGCGRFALETGDLQPEAIALYERCGYRRCGPFGAYTEDPNSVFMMKDRT